jgi:hypothetical protein
MRIMALSVLAFLGPVLGIGAAHAQVSPTEQYVPIGQTTAESVMQGTLSSVAPQAGVQPQAAGAPAQGATASFTMKTGGVDRTYLIDPHTRIYLDRSRSGQPNELGDLADLRSGKTVEAYVPDLSARLALWIKVRP